MIRGEGAMIRRWWRTSVQFRLVSFFLLLSWSSVVTVGTLAFVRARQELSGAALTRLEAAASLKGDELRRWIEGQRRDVLVLAAWPDLKRTAAAALRAYTPDDQPGVTGGLVRLRGGADAVRRPCSRRNRICANLHPHLRRRTHRLLQQCRAHRRVARARCVFRQGAGADVRADGVSLAGDGPSAREPGDAAPRSGDGARAGRARGAPESRRDGSHHARAVRARAGQRDLSGRSLQRVHLGGAVRTSALSARHPQHGDRRGGQR